ncbi:hypothetical protein ACFYPA_05915 [Streptomyces sp. NPDC005775]|uniref:hypothetical protein n=1 Tax=Streptomyces sp. NPDC005775 TaxID=3364729 RepID=UPI003680A8EC
MDATQNTSTETRKAAPAGDRSMRPVIEHALTVYFDGNAELAGELIDRLLAEDQNR